ncbi:MAG TPA: cyclopropane-fatty-acyl-phospholipid synthase family protein [Thermoleophilaceae bacterium]|nr:cyclopropane-fatty-acyl-phospholipid synthase family protein [Thermoleophilaceae bacterium]
MAFSNTTPLREEIDRVVPSRPFRVEFWDGSSLPATENGAGPTFTVRSPRAVAQALAAPGQLGLGRAYVTGDLAVDDIDAVAAMLREWSPPPVETADKLKLMAGAVRAAGVTLPARPPAAEFRPKGRRHTRGRDQRAVRHHYDVSNDYFRLFLDESMTYSCAIFSRGATTLEEAQVAKLDLVCTKLDLRPGMRIVDIGSGWGAFAIHAAQHYGVHVTGITVSQNQADGATENAERAGVGDQVDFRVQDYRDLTGETFDAVASIGMVEHVGEERIDEYTRKLASLVGPGGQVLNHGIARLRHSDPDAGDFSERYVFPDADPIHVSRIIDSFERAGMPLQHAEDFRMDYAETLRHWAERFDSNLEEAERLGGPERVRVWRLYLRAARSGFETGFTGLYQVRVRKPG